MAKSQCVGEAEEARRGEREDIRICEYLNLKLPFINNRKMAKSLLLCPVSVGNKCNC